AGRDHWTTGSNVTAAPLGTPARVLPCLILSARDGRHVGVAKVIVNNNPETMTLPLWLFRTAASWCFARVLMLRDARTRVRLCGSACTCALLRMKTASHFS